MSKLPFGKFFVIVCFASLTPTFAHRIRPKQQKEEINMCNICTRVSPSEPQIWLGRDENTFTFDHVFDIPSNQNEIYSKCVEPLVDG